MLDDFYIYHPIPTIFGTSNAYNNTKWATDFIFWWKFVYANVNGTLTIHLRHIKTYLHNFLPLLMLICEKYK